MATSTVPVRIRERQPQPHENPTSRPAGWRHEKKPIRFVIKIAGIVPC